MGLRDRMQERRAENSGEQFFTMRQKMLSIGDDYWIQDSSGNRVFKVDGKALRVRETLKFDDAQGNELLKIQERIARVRDTMKIEDANGNTVATVKKAMITPLRERWHVESPNGDLKIQGNIVDHEYEIEQDGDTIATVSKRWFRVRDTYGIEIDTNADIPLVLSVTIAVDDMSRD